MATAPRVFYHLPGLAPNRSPDAARDGLPAANRADPAFAKDPVAYVDRLRELRGTTKEHRITEDEVLGILDQEIAPLRKHPRKPWCLLCVFCTTL